MRTLILNTFWLFLPLYCTQALGQDGEQSEEAPEAAPFLLPTVMISILVRNKAHTLPYFLHYLESLDYPKHRISLWIRGDHNTDDSRTIVDTWLSHVKPLYHSVDIEWDDSQSNYQDQRGPCDWSRERFRQVIKLRQASLAHARQIWADYILLVDADNILVKKELLQDLMDEQQMVIAPMLNATASEYYTNFWAGMDEKGYYVRTSDYLPILTRNVEGCFQVPMIHSTILIDLRYELSQHLAYDPPPPDYRGPLDDIIIFAQVAKHYGIPLHVANRDLYGFLLVPMESHNSITEEAQQFIHMKVENIVDGTPLKKLEYMSVPVVKPTLINFNQVYMINLKRRPDRRNKMMSAFEELGIRAHTIDAIDGRELNDTYLADQGIKMLPGYADPYHGRAISMGEIGCFLSHYNIWKDIVSKKYELSLVFEDDIRFHVYFKEKLQSVLEDLKILHKPWDLIYIGRKKLDHDNEAWVQNLEHLVWPQYSYWTLGYLISLQGAKKLLRQQPLGKLVPVDEYLPIMFDKHPEEGWKAAFEPRDLIAFSAEPLLIEPTHYTGEPGYITDTDESIMAPGEVVGQIYDQEEESKGDDGDLKDEL